MILDRIWFWAEQHRCNYGEFQIYEIWIYLKFFGFLLEFFWTFKKSSKNCWMMDLKLKQKIYLSNLRDFKFWIKWNSKFETLIWNQITWYYQSFTCINLLHAKISYITEFNIYCLLTFVAFGMMALCRPKDWIVSLCGIIYLTFSGKIILILRLCEYDQRRHINYSTKCVHRHFKNLKLNLKWYLVKQSRVFIYVR